MQSYQRLEDEQLAKMARDDHDAFEILYQRHVTAVYRYCYGRVDNINDAEDLTTQTFLAALESLGRYRGRGSFRAWLFGIARNKCHDFYRTVYSHPQHETGSQDITEAPDVADVNADDPEALLITQGFLDCIERMLPALSPDRMEALRLRYWGDLRMREIARVMRRTEAAVKMLVSRAISDLRERCVVE